MYINLDTQFHSQAVRKTQFALALRDLLDTAEEEEKHAAG